MDERIPEYIASDPAGTIPGGAASDVPGRLLVADSPYRDRGVGLHSRLHPGTRELGDGRL